MTKVNKMIEEKLQSYPDNVKKLARIAIEQAKNIHDANLAEYLNTASKKIVRGRQQG